MKLELLSSCMRVFTGGCVQCHAAAAAAVLDDISHPAAVQPGAVRAAPVHAEPQLMLGRASGEFLRARVQFPYVQATHLVLTRRRFSEGGCVASSIDTFIFFSLSMIYMFWLVAMKMPMFRNYVMTLAPMRFTQPSIMMLVVGIASLPIHNQHEDTFESKLRVAWFMFQYDGCARAFLVVGLALQRFSAFPLLEKAGSNLSILHHEVAVGFWASHTCAPAFARQGEWYIYIYVCVCVREPTNFFFGQGDCPMAAFCRGSAATGQVMGIKLVMMPGRLW